MPSKITVEELLDYPFDKLSRRRQQRLNVYEICAEDFLQFANKDSKSEDLRSRVNTLGNVKRAIECRVDTILYNFCLHKKSQGDNWDFPDKIKIIRQLGIVAPDILRRINKKRNELEHHYKRPTEDDVSDGLDVAALFLRATDDRAIVTYDAPNHFAIELRHKEGFVKLTDYKNNVEKIARINRDDGWIEFARRLSRLLEPSPISFHKSERSS